MNTYFPFHKLIDDFGGGLPQDWLGPNPKTTFQSNNWMLLKLCIHKVWHYTYGDMHSTCVWFHSLHMQHFLYVLTMKRNSKFAMVELHTHTPLTHLWKQLTSSWIAGNKMLEYIKVVIISILCPWFDYG